MICFGSGKQAEADAESPAQGLSLDGSPWKRRWRDVSRTRANGTPWAIPCSAGLYLTSLPLHAVACLGFYVLETAAVTASLILEAVFLYCIFVPLFEKYW